MKVFVDADACPVKAIVQEEVLKRHLPLIFVTSYAHFSNQPPPDGVEVVYVDTGADAADYRIMQLALRGDLIVTQDYGLASLALAKGCTVLHHSGFEYTQENIGQLLESRHFSAKMRRSGLRTKGPKPFTAEERNRFRQLLQKLLDVRLTSE
ncbi:YaiI/YqxD family protein [Aciduricibacillus chroicocephali]|uniref:UPF0178 protein QR721_01855 n=1 Tax=Aciduricibacillus chroicocephali TaxID=3054939 RepID=A0ABY9KZI6_9BACI|nr:YaiI/YqxD family protein [Bacillaceae bacterium 44XB]